MDVCDWLEDYKETCVDLDGPLDGWCKPCLRARVTELADELDWTKAMMNDPAEDWHVWMLERATPKET